MPEPQGESPQDADAKKKRGMPAVFTLLLLLVGLTFFVHQVSGFGEKELNYDEFLKKLYSSDVKSLHLKGSGAGGTAVVKLYSEAEAAYEVRLPASDLRRERLDEFLSYTGKPAGLLGESEFLSKLEAGELLPSRVWGVSLANSDAFFADYWLGRDKERRVWLRPDDWDDLVAGDEGVSLNAWERADAQVDAVRLAAALGQRGLILDTKAVAGTDPAKPDGAAEPAPLFSFQPENTLLITLFWNIVPWLLIIGVFWFLIFRQMRNPGGAGGVLSFGRARPSMVAKDRTGVSFEDVAGAEEAKAEVREIVEFLKDPTRFSRVGARIPRGILLVGRPGTGKTLLARAIAGEANVPFFSISGSDFVEMFVGVGASRVRDLFRQAREKSPCLIFLDEIDAVGRRRGSGLGGGHDEREQTLNAILVEMDGFDSDEGIILIAATNRPDVLDPALLRPGRFDRQITIDLPDVQGREAILKVHTRNVRLEPSVDLSVIARGTPGFSGAELSSLVNEAALQAVLDGREKVCLADLEEARDRVRFGREKSSRVMEEKDKLITAYHEAGHAIVGALTPGVEPLHKVTIIPRGMALGATMVLPKQDRYHQRREEMTGYITFAFGGRLAEEIFCGDVTSGAYDDIRRATEMARMMVCQFGMSEALGPVNYDERDESIFLGNEVVKHRNYSEETAQKIDIEVRAILDECYVKAREVIDNNRDAVESLTRSLMKYEVVQGEEVEAIIRGSTPEEAHETFLARTRPTVAAAADATPVAPLPEDERPSDDAPTT